MSNAKVKSLINLEKNTIDLITADNDKNANIKLDCAKEEISEKSKTIDIQGSEKVSISGKDINIKADSSVVIEAGKQITLKVGAVKIDITSSSIAIEAMASKVNLTSSKIEMASPTVSISGTASAEIKTINLDLKAVKTTL